MTVSFRVEGTPAPKGSWRAFVVGGRARLVADNARTEPWCQAVTAAAHVAAGQAGASYPMFASVPVAVDIVFILRRPSSHHGARGLRPAAPPHPAVKPDIDKLARSTLDAMTGPIFDDDSRIVSLVATKVYAVGPERPGARITVRAV